MEEECIEGGGERLANDEILSTRAGEFKDLRIKEYNRKL